MTAPLHRWALMCALAWVLWLPPARAAEPPAPPSTAVVVLADRSGDEDRDPTVRRVHAELEAAGFAVMRVPGPGEAEALQPWALRLLRETDALAVALLPGGRAGVPLEWWQRARAESVTHRSIRSSRGGTEDAEVVAIRVSELASAAAQELERALPPAPARTAGAPEAPPAPAPPFWRVNVGVGPLWSPGGLSFMLQPTLGASLAFGKKRRFGIAADAAATVLRARVDVDETRHRVGFALIRAHAVWWIRPGQRVSPTLALGGGVATGWTGPAPTRRTAVAVLSAGPGLAVALSPRVALAVGLHAAVALPRFELRSGDERIAHAGLPFLDGWVGLQIRG